MEERFQVVIDAQCGPLLSADLPPPHLATVGKRRPVPAGTRKGSSSQRPPCPSPPGAAAAAATGRQEASPEEGDIPPLGVAGAAVGSGPLSGWTIPPLEAQDGTVAGERGREGRGEASSSHLSALIEQMALLGETQSAGMMDPWLQVGYRVGLRVYLGHWQAIRFFFKSVFFFVRNHCSDLAHSDNRWEDQ